jgi:hypothetical protein
MPNKSQGILALCFCGLANVCVGALTLEGGPDQLLASNVLVVHSTQAVYWTSSCNGSLG